MSGESHSGFKFHVYVEVAPTLRVSSARGYQPHIPKPSLGLPIGAGVLPENNV